MTYTFMGQHVPVVRQWLCSNAAFPKPVPGCSCDTECILFHDCCVDGFEKVFGITDKEALINVVIKPELVYVEANPFSLDASYLTLFHKYSSCHVLNINNTYVSIAVIDKCPEENTTELNRIYQQKCNNFSADIIRSIPVTLTISSSWQVVFRNIFCALCHGIDKEDIVLWEAHAKCPKNMNLTEYNSTAELSFSTCTGVYNAPQNLGHLRQCFRDGVFRSACNGALGQTWDGNSICPVYIAPVAFGGSIYRNSHCAYCDKHIPPGFGNPSPLIDVQINSVSPQLVTTPVLPLPSVKPVNKPPSMIILFDFSFQIGLVFKASGKSHHSASTRCDSTSVYDFISNSCKPVVCPLGRVWQRGQCIHDRIAFINDSDVLPTSTAIEDVMYLMLTVKAPQAMNDTIRLQGYIHILKEFFTTYTKNNKNCEIVTEPSEISPVIETPSPQTMDGYNMSLSYINIRLKYGGKLYELIKIITTFTRLARQRSINSLANHVLNVSLSNTYLNQTYNCTDMRHLKTLKGLTFYLQNETVYLLDKFTNIAYRALDTRFFFGFKPDLATPEVNDAVICSLLQCPQMKLSSEDYEIKNETLRLRATGEQLSPKDYEIRNESVYVCIPGRQKKNFLYSFIYGAQILQTVTYCLSIIALILTIIIYIKSSSVRTLHGKTLVSLSVCLIGGQLTSFLQSEAGNIWCKIVAVIMHFSWLAAFGWMSMISYDMKRTFYCSQTSIIDAHASRKRYFIYSIFGWLVPGIIVIICIILDSVDAPHIIQIDYGKNGACFIGDQEAILVFFSIPNGTSIIFNTIAFILTVCAISKNRKAIPNSKRSKNRLYFVIYLKLAVVMGVTWVFAILAPVMNQIVFWYIHLILNGLQGVFVFLSFALRSSIWKKMKIKKPRTATFLSKTSTFYSISGGSAQVI